MFDGRRPDVRIYYSYIVVGYTFDLFIRLHLYVTYLLYKDALFYCKANNKRKIHHKLFINTKKIFYLMTLTFIRLCALLVVKYLFLFIALVGILVQRKSFFFITVLQCY